MTQKTTEKSDSYDIILQAAAQRILHYGYNKTTMAEIANDCDMSAGNIYRFFPSKIHIAEAMTRKWDAEAHEAFKAIIKDGGRSASRKLTDFFRFKLDRNFSVCREHPKLGELVEIMGRERPDYIQEELAQERRYIGQILEGGVAAGDFVLPQDVDTTADLIQCAMYRFQLPFFWDRDSLELLHAELEGVLQLMFTGLAARQ